MSNKLEAFNFRPWKVKCAEKKFIKIVEQIYASEHKEI
jgi:hypothetical protein